MPSLSTHVDGSHPTSMLSAHSLYRCFSHALLSICCYLMSLCGICADNRASLGLSLSHLSRKINVPIGIIALPHTQLSLPVAMAILGGYAGLYVLYSIGSAIGGKKKVVVTAPAPSVETTTTTGAVPPIDSPEFEKFLESDAFLKLLESDELLTAALEKA